MLSLLGTHQKVQDAVTRGDLKRIVAECPLCRGAGRATKHDSAMSENINVDCSGCAIAREAMRLR